MENIMKKYKVTFTDDYLSYEQYANNNTDEYLAEYWKNHINENKDKLEMCKKWSGKEITLFELEELIGEFGEVIFNGDTISIINGILD